jgi:hypothetical protein
MSTNQPPAARSVSVTYAPGVLLSVPIIADETVLDQLYAHSQHANGLELRALALHLGITEPSRHHQWVIGKEQSDGTRLVWYDPEKLAAIDDEIRYCIEHFGPDVALVVTQCGPGWDEWDVDMTGVDVEADPWVQAIVDKDAPAGDEPGTAESAPAAAGPPGAGSIQVPVPATENVTGEAAAPPPPHPEASTAADPDIIGPGRPEPTVPHHAPADREPRGPQDPPVAGR